MADAIAEARALETSGRTDTSDTVATQGEAHTVSEEPLITQINEDIANQKIEQQAAEAPAEKPAGEEPPEKKQPAEPTAKAMPDGTYQVRRPDGTTVTLTEEELGKVAAKRVARYAYQRADADRQAAALRAENEALKRRLEQASSPQGEGQGAQAEDAKPTWESGEFATIDEYVDARDAWRERQREKAARPAQEQGAAPQGETVEVNGQKLTLPTGFSIDKFNDWNAHTMKVLEDGGARFADFTEKVTDPSLSFFDPVFTDFIYSESEDAAAVLYALASDPEHATALRQDLAAGKATRVARELGIIEARTSPRSTDDSPPDGSTTSESGADQHTRTRTKVSKAPPPPTPVQASGGAGIRKDPDDMTQAEYEAFRAAGGGR